jgi:hypothetical protein
VWRGRKARKGTTKRKDLEDLQSRGYSSCSLMSILYLFTGCSDSACLQHSFALMKLLATSPFPYARRFKARPGPKMSFQIPPELCLMGYDGPFASARLVVMQTGPRDLLRFSELCVWKLDGHFSTPDFCKTQSGVNVVLESQTSLVKVEADALVSMSDTQDMKHPQKGMLCQSTSS